jgi:hypothetical protein
MFRCTVSVTVEFSSTRLPAFGLWSITFSVAGAVEV